MYCLTGFQADWLTYWGLDKMIDILHTTFSCAFSWMFCVLIHILRKFVPKVSVHNKSASVQVRAKQATSHYLNQRWPSLVTHICITQSRWVNLIKCYFWFVLRHSNWNTLLMSSPVQCLSGYSPRTARGYPVEWPCHAAEWLVRHP